MNKPDWTPLKGYEESYLINKSGQVYSIKYKKIMKQSINKWGYATMGIYKNKKRFNVRVNRLVASTFIPNPENLEQVNHIDGNKLNDHVSNLEWCSRLDNMRHASKNGIMASADRNGKSKLTTENVLDIVKMFSMDISCQEIADYYKVDRSTISCIKRGKSWVGVTGIKQIGETE